MRLTGKNLLLRQIITCEVVALLLIITLLWLDEFADIPYLLLGAMPTPVNWRESLIETLLILPIALAIFSYTKSLFDRMEYLEGLVPICSNCKRIKDKQGEWQQIESYICDRSEASFSHGICPDCAEELYPDVFAPKKVTLKKYPGR